MDTIAAFRPSGITLQPITVTPLGELRIQAPPTQKMTETWDSGTLDLINRWVATNGGGGVIPTASVGNCAINGGVTNNGFSKLTTLGVGAGGGVFKPAAPGSLFQDDRVGIQTLGSLGSAFWGKGTSPGAPTIAAPMTNGFGWEYNLGAMTPVVWASGTRVPAVFGAAKGLPTLLTNAYSQIPDTSNHNYFSYFEGRRGFWCVDDYDNVVAQFLFGNGGPDVNALPLLYQAISNGNATPLILNVGGIDLGDTADTSGALLLNNGLTYDEMRPNTDANAALITLTAVGSSTVNSADQINVNGRGVSVLINLTALTAGTLTVNIQGKDPVSGQYYTIASSFPITAAAVNNTVVYPGITPVAASNTVGSFSAVLPRTWRVQAVIATGPATATIGASVIL